MVGSNITHLVTLTSPAATPLAGAKVSLTLYKCCGEAPVPGPFCTTGSDGTCSVDIKSMVQGNYGTLSGLVEATGHGTLVINSITTPSYYEDEALQYPYVGELVMDRSIVMPGDKLHITGTTAGPAGASAAARMACLGFPFGQLEHVPGAACAPLARAAAAVGGGVWCCCTAGRGYAGSTQQLLYSTMMHPMPRWQMRIQQQ